MNDNVDNTIRAAFAEEVARSGPAQERWTEIDRRTDRQSARSGIWQPKWLVPLAAAAAVAAVTTVVVVSKPHAPTAPSSQVGTPYEFETSEKSSETETVSPSLKETKTKTASPSATEAKTQSPSATTSDPGSTSTTDQSTTKVVTESSPTKESQTSHAGPTSPYVIELLAALETMNLELHGGQVEHPGASEIAERDGIYFQFDTRPLGGLTRNLDVLEVVSVEGVEVSFGKERFGLAARFDCRQTTFNVMALYSGSTAEQRSEALPGMVQELIVALSCQA